jgi:hypothetical protein
MAASVHDQVVRAEWAPGKVPLKRPGAQLAYKHRISPLENKPSSSAPQSDCSRDGSMQQIDIVTIARGLRRSFTAVTDTQALAATEVVLEGLMGAPAGCTTAIGQECCLAPDAQSLPLFWITRPC